MESASLSHFLAPGASPIDFSINVTPLDPAWKTRWHLAVRIQVVKTNPPFSPFQQFNETKLIFPWLLLEVFPVQRFWICNWDWKCSFASAKVTQVPLINAVCDCPVLMWPASNTLASTAAPFTEISLSKVKKRAAFSTFVCWVNVSQLNF